MSPRAAVHGAGRVVPVVPIRLGPIDRALLALERPGRPWFATLLAFGLLWLALQRVTLGRGPTYLGKSYAMLAADPFHPSPDNPVAHRLLAPLVSWLLGLRGPYLLYTNLLAVLALLGAVYLWMRRIGHPPSRAAVAPAVLALSAVVLVTVHYGGYTDVFTYALVFAAWASRRRVAVASAWLLLAALNHESALLLAPWLAVALARSDPAGSRGALRAVAGVGAAIAAFAVIRIALERVHPSSSAYSGGFYLAPLLRDPFVWFRESAPHRAFGIVSAFDLFWVLPLLAAIRLAMRGARAEAATLLLPIPCALAALFVAYDVTRLAALAFPSVLLGAEYLLRTNGFHARRWAPVLVAAQLFVPAHNVAMGIVDAMRR